MYMNTTFSRQSTHYCRVLARSSNHYVTGVVGVGELVGGELGRVDREEVVAVLAREMALETSFKLTLFQDLQRDLLKIDEVRDRGSLHELRAKHGLQILCVSLNILCMSKETYST